MSGVAGSSTGTPAATGGSGALQWKGKNIEIRDVWASNLEAEMALIRELVPQYPYVALDTEFPGIVARPVGAFPSHVDYTYQTLRCNVDMLKLIQVGLTFADATGKVPDGCPTWQFNFSFSLVDDMFAEDSIALLKASGINFSAHQSDGISVEHFGELLMASGLVLVDDVRWLSFHSGYDFGYLLKLLTAQPLPADERSFTAMLKRYFPHVYDIKTMCTAVPALSGGLNRVAEALGVPRVGRMHQAGSDSLLTSAVYFELVAKHFQGRPDGHKYEGGLYGLGAASSVAAAPAPGAARPTSKASAAQAPAPAPKRSRARGGKDRSRRGRS